MGRRFTQQFSLCGALFLSSAAVLAVDDAGELPTPAEPPILLDQHETTYPLPVLIEQISGYQVIPWNGQLQDLLRDAAESVRAAAQAQPVTSGRINEVGLRVEQLLRTALEAEGFNVDTPRTQSGRRQSAGYPDLVARKDGQTFYVEVKCFSEGTTNSTQRTFYLSPSDDPKIREDAHHLLFGFQVKEVAEGQYSVESYEVLDLFGLECAMKVEFNASNRDLYNGELTILKSGE
ncbi:hypothetical protein [Cerasicoccus frondis]|uniref:hypothetical protein n=1 Tax=Cerasicoccus frondis TaxID=490090 RepID=UPI002852C44E|nr:hypothetical protein [Cerasicoccus frondis]